MTIALFVVLFLAGTAAVIAPLAMIGVCRLVALASGAPSSVPPTCAEVATAQPRP